MRREIYIGVDGGGGSTECIIANASGELLGKGVSSGSNIFSSGVENSEKAIMNSIIAAGYKEDDVVISVCFGLSGVLYGIENQEVEQMTRRVLPQTKKRAVVCDAVTTLTGAIGAGSGICINAGTGAICLGKNRKGEIAVSSGWGHILGDEGSGFWIGLQGLISAMRGIDGRSEPTNLSKTLFEALKVKNPSEASKLIHAMEDPKAIISSLCPLVFDSAEGGDSVANNIVKKAGYELALAVWSVAKNIFNENCEIDVAPVGNCLIKENLLRGYFNDSLEKLLPLANIVEPKYSPTVGSLLYAFMNAGIDFENIKMDTLSKLAPKVQ